MILTALQAICAALLPVFMLLVIIIALFLSTAQREAAWEGISGLFKKCDWCQCQDCNIWHNTRNGRTSFEPPEDWDGCAHYRTCSDCEKALRGELFNSGCGDVAGVGCIYDTQQSSTRPNADARLSLSDASQTAPSYSTLDHATNEDHLLQRKPDEPAQVQSL